DAQGRTCYRGDNIARTSVSNGLRTAKVNRISRSRCDADSYDAGGAAGEAGRDESLSPRGGPTHVYVNAVHHRTVVHRHGAAHLCPGGAIDGGAHYRVRGRCDTEEGIEICSGCSLSNQSLTRLQVRRVIECGNSLGVIGCVKKDSLVRAKVLQLRVRRSETIERT